MAFSFATEAMLRRIRPELRRRLAPAHSTTSTGTIVVVLQQSHVVLCFAKIVVGSRAAIAFKLP
jgi:hypothetical protein